MSLTVDTFDGPLAPQVEPALPDDILELIVQTCSRFTLWRCCLVNQALYRLAVIHLYRDPFTLDKVDYTSPFDNTRAQHRSRRLSETLLADSSLVRLIRFFSDYFWGLPVETRFMDAIGPYLTGITHVEFHHDESVLACPFKELQVASLISVTFGKALKRWVEDQISLKKLRVRNESVCDEEAYIIIPTLTTLSASFQVAMMIVRYSPLLELECIVPVTDISELFKLLRAHSPNLQTINITATPGSAKDRNVGYFNFRLLVKTCEIVLHVLKKML